MHSFTAPGKEKSGKLAYIICSSPEMGRALLATGLSNTGVAGNPSENIDVNDADIAQKIARATTVNSICGIALHWSSGDTAEAMPSKALLLAERLEAQFDEVRYLWLRRRNKIAQGIARYRSSRPRELPPQALTEPYVSLSVHTALVVQL